MIASLHTFPESSGFFTNCASGNLTESHAVDAPAFTKKSLFVQAVWFTAACYAIRTLLTQYSEFESSSGSFRTVMQTKPSVTPIRDRGFLCE